MSRGYWPLQQRLANVKIDPKGFCFIDVGSGKGRVLIMAAQNGFNQVIGVELSPDLHAIAEHNLKNYQSKVGRKIQALLYNDDALAFELPNAPTVLFMFNPFDEVIMTQFVEKIDKSLEQNPREFYLIYIHPAAEAALETLKRLRKIFKNANVTTSPFIVQLIDFGELEQLSRGERSSVDHRPT